MISLADTSRPELPERYRGAQASLYLRLRTGPLEWRLERRSGRGMVALQTTARYRNPPVGRRKIMAEVLSPEPRLDLLGNTRISTDCFKIGVGRKRGWQDVQPLKR